MNTKGSSEKTGIYIIDRNYRLIHFNDTLKRWLEDIRRGGACCEGLYGGDRSCQGCLLSRDSDRAVMSYDKATQQWMKVSSENVDWPDLGPCRVILAWEINEGSKNLLCNLTSTSAYDRLFELNFIKDYYKILYHQERRYAVPVPGGTLNFMVQEISGHMAHPEDARCSSEFWESRYIISRLSGQHAGRILKGEFHK